MLSHSSAIAASRHVGRSLFHNSATLQARPKYGVGKGRKFTPARARLAENPSLSTPPRISRTPRLARINTPFGSKKHSATSDSSDSATPRRTRTPKRELIMEVPAVTRDSAPHLSPSTGFTSPPLLPGLVAQINRLLGSSAKPTPVQALSLSHFFHDNSAISPSPGGTLLAAETGSGKSLAYLLPMVQSLKQAEITQNADTPPLSLAQSPSIDEDSASAAGQESSSSSRLATPQALILVPTHELARQIKSTLSHLTHADDTKLRTICLSHAPGSRKQTNKEAFSTSAQESSPGRDPDERPWGVNVVIGTPSKILDFTRPEGRHSVGPKRPGDEISTKFKGNQEIKMSLSKVKWVVVDEADVLFGEFAHFPTTQNLTIFAIDPDFSSWTEAVLQDVQTASSRSPNLILTTATVSSHLSTYLSTHHPSLTRLATPNLHKLPSSLQTEHVHWDRRPGNRLPTVLRKMQDMWAEEERNHPGWKEKSKVVVFCNRSNKVEELGTFLEEKGVKCVSLTSTSDARARGSNRHIRSFLKPLPRVKKAQLLTDSVAPDHTDDKSQSLNERDQPRVLITTSLLSRGLDFSPLVTSVFIVDEPRNEVDYIHRAGRTGRAGRPGRVVVFTDGQGGRERTVKGTRKVWGFDAA